MFRNLKVTAKVQDTDSRDKIKEIIYKTSEFFITHAFFGEHILIGLSLSKEPKSYQLHISLEIIRHKIPIKNKREIKEITTDKQT